MVFSTIHSYSQDKSTSVFGKIMADSIAVKDVHIFNLTSRKGTISNNYGEFQIPVKENDTILISDIQYEQQKIVIDKNHLNNLQLNIRLLSKINELKEVQIKEHELSGNLNNDAQNTKLENKISKDLQGSNAYKTDMRVVDDYDMNKDPDARELTDPTMQAAQGNIVGLLTGLGLKLLLNEVSKIGQKKRLKKRELKIYEKESIKAPDRIRNELGDLFFTNTLKIPSQHIDSFINHCKTKGVIKTYLNGNKIEAIDILIKESKPFLKIVEDEK